MSNDHKLSWEDMQSLKIEINILKYKLMWCKRYILLSFLFGVAAAGLGEVVYFLATRGTG